MTEAQTISLAVPEWTIGDRLRKAREHAELTQSELAREIGIGRTSVTHYETGKKKLPRVKLLAWSLRCGVPPQWIQTGIYRVKPDPDAFSLVRTGMSSPALLPQNCASITLIRPIGTRGPLTVKAA